MTKMIFVNLPVRDLAKSLAFYEALGGKVNPQFSSEDTKCLTLSEAISVMLLTHDRYATFTKRPIGDARKESQALIAITVESRATVDATLKSAVAAGGKADPNPKHDYSFMYNRSVEDPDGYVWEVVWMDAAAMKAEQSAATA